VWFGERCEPAHYPDERLHLVGVDQVALFGLLNAVDQKAKKYNSLH